MFCELVAVSNSHASIKQGSVAGTPRFLFDVCTCTLHSQHPERDLRDKRQKQKDRGEGDRCKTNVNCESISENYL